ncbi:MAG: rod shape-determining protein MreC [Elusimicrobiota bacterium]|jgi:rod shape-determining protein MreC|nr:rod shape-determining protein MreC [Elusimicrobiota bacterium]
MQNERRSKYTNIVFIIIVLISIVVLFLRATPYVSLVKNFVYYLAYPSVDATRQILTVTGSFADSIKSYTALHQENLKYRRLNQELSDRLRYYNAMKTEYDNLIALLQIPKIEYKDTVFARISAREPSQWYQWFIIDKGSAEGLRNDLPVLMLGKNGGLNAVGVIVETYQHSSKIALITNLLSVVPVEIKGKNINCLAEGTNSSTLKITYIPLNADIAKGDEVVASRLSSVFDEGTLIGVIENVSNKPSVDFKDATAKITFDSSVVDMAIILVPRKEAK